MVSPAANSTASLSSLPDEVLVGVLQNLPFDALQKMRITDKRFYGLISDTPVILLNAMETFQDPRIAVLGAKTLGKVESLVAKFLELRGMDKWEMDKWNWDALLKNSKYTLDDIGTPSANVRSLDLNQLHRRFQFFNSYVPLIYKFNINHFYPNASSNRDLALAVVKRRGEALKDVDPSFQKDFEIVLAAATQFGFSIGHADPSLRTNDTVLKAAVSNCGGALRYGNSSQKKDPEFVIPAVVAYGMALQDADPYLQDDELIVRIAMLQDLEAVEHASARLQNKLKIDESMYSNFVRESMQYFEQVNFPLIKNKSFVLRIIRITRGLVFQYLDPSWQNDEDLLKAALIRNASALSFASDRLKQKYTKDKKTVLFMISRRTKHFMDIDPSLQDDEEVLQAALLYIGKQFFPAHVQQQRDLILQSASDRLQKKYNNRKLIWLVR